MHQGSRLFETPRSAILQWICHPGAAIPPRIAAELREGLLSPPLTVLVGVVNGLLLNCAAIFLGGGIAFWAFIGLDALLVSARFFEFRRIRRRSRQGSRTPADFYLLTCVGWCAVQGAIGFVAMRTGIAPLQVIGGMTIVGLVGPICMRNFAAPRYALLMLSLTLGPLVCGAAMSGDRWLLILALQTPAFVIGASRMLGRMQALTISTLLAEAEGLERARRDPLTGLLNRAGLNEAIAAVGEAIGTGSVVFYLDLDGFKPINDLHGHKAGDTVLKSVAARLLSAARSDDIVARLGGDEFVIIGAGLGAHEGERLASRIIREVATEPFQTDGPARVRIGVSVGFACSPADASAFEELTRKADAALYEAKAAGKGVARRYIHRGDVAVCPTAYPVQVSVNDMPQPGRQPAAHQCLREDAGLVSS